MKTMKRFDCVEMKRRAQETIQVELEGKTVSEQLDYWRRRNAEFRRWMSARTTRGRNRNSAVRKAR